MIDPLTPATKDHFELYSDSTCSDRLAFVRNPTNDTWHYGLLHRGGRTFQHEPIGDFPSSYSAHEHAKARYPEIMDWKELKRLGKV